ncbi:ferritin-like domain-containing protein [bacterium]|nr:MAG: ferritin-like domain-containing protein [bacterium]
MQLTFSEALKKELQRCHSLEWHLFDNLKMLAGVAQNPELKAALERHREETRVHLERLETIGARLKIPVVGVPNLAIRALAVELLEDWGGAEPGPMTDAIIIEAAQKGEHLEMAWYGFLKSWCQQLGEPEIVALLEQTLEEEKRTDELLTQLAESGINQQAAALHNLQASVM